MRDPKRHWCPWTAALRIGCLIALVGFWWAVGKWVGVW